MLFAAAIGFIGISDAKLIKGLIGAGLSGLKGGTKAVGAAVKQVAKHEVKELAARAAASMSGDQLAGALADLLGLAPGLSGAVLGAAIIAAPCFDEYAHCRGIDPAAVIEAIKTAVRTSVGERNRRLSEKEEKMRESSDGFGESPVGRPGGYDSIIDYILSRILRGN